MTFIGNLAIADSEIESQIETEIIIALSLMEAFSPIPPEWVEKATHAHSFCCSQCGQPPSKAEAVWVNRRSPVYTENHQRKWQEFYRCECQSVWWAWSNDRPPSEFRDRALRNNQDDDFLMG